MSNITWPDKNNTDPKGTPKRTFSSDDANEVKTAVNSKADNTANLSGLSNLPVGTGFVRKTAPSTFILSDDVGASSFEDLTGGPYDNVALAEALDDKQDEDSDLTAIAELTPTNDDFLQRKSGVWANRTPAQVKVDLAIDQVDNTPDSGKVVSTAQAAAIAAAQAAAQSYADGLVVGLWDDRGAFSAAGGAYPSTGGSGSAGAILKGDIWTISVAGTLPTGQVVEIGDVIRAVVNTPGNTQANWAITQNNIGYVPENVTNKGASSGYMGLDATFRAIIKNIAGTISSFITSIATVARTYTLPDKDMTFAGIDDIPTKADQATVDAGTNDTQFVTSSTNRDNQEKVRYETANFAVNPADRGTQILTNSGSDLTATINQITPKNAANLPQVQIIPRGAGNVNLAAGTGVSFVGSTFIEAGGGALLSWISATVVQVVTGASAQWPQILLKPTTVVGFAMTDAWRVLFQTFTPVGTPNSTTETDLLSRDVGSNLMAFDGERVIIRAAGTFAATANAKRIRVLLGSTVVVDTTSAVVNNAKWVAIMEIMRTGTDSQVVWVTLAYGSVSITGFEVKTASDMSAALLLTIKGTGVVTADVTLGMATGDKTGKA